MTKKKLIILIVSIILAIGLIVGGTVWGVTIYNQKKVQKLLKEYYETKVTEFAKENAEIGTCDVVFVGDSITDGCDLTKFYPTLNAANRGIGGDTTTGVLNRMDVSIYDLQPKVVVLLIGANNIYTMLENYEDILVGIHTNLPETKVVIVSLTAMSGSFSSKNETAISNNEVLAGYATKYGYTYADVFTSLYDEAHNCAKDGLMVDIVHPGDAGYQIMASIITPIVEDLLSQE